jgi:hypothetical protein
MMNLRRITLFALSMSLLLSSLGPASAITQGPGLDEGGDRSLESLRASLLTSVAIETEGAVAFGKPGLEVIAIKGPENVEAFVRDLGHGLPEIYRTRVFDAGRWRSGDKAAAIDRQEALYHRATGSLFVVGRLGNRVTIEDVRTLEEGGRVFVLRDIYLDGEAADLRVGRSLPVLLESTSAKATAVPQVTTRRGSTPGPSTARTSDPPRAGCRSRAGTCPRGRPGAPPRSWPSRRPPPVLRRPQHCLR